MIIIPSCEAKVRQMVYCHSFTEQDYDFSLYSLGNNCLSCLYNAISCRWYMGQEFLLCHHSLTHHWLFEYIHQTSFGFDYFAGNHIDIRIIHACHQYAFTLVCRRNPRRHRDRRFHSRILGLNHHKPWNMVWE
jgi:hypothetical protein